MGFKQFKTRLKHFETPWVSNGQTRLWRLKRWINMRIITEFEVHTGSRFLIHSMCLQNAVDAMQ